MPGPTPSGRFSPAEVVASYRRISPGRYDLVSDKDLLDSIQNADPATFALVDPLLIGSEILGETREGMRARPVQPSYPKPPRAPAPPPVPPSLPLGDRVALGAAKALPTGLRVAGPIIGGTLGVLGGPASPATIPVAGALGSAAVEGPAQWVENLTGAREGYSGTEGAVNTALGAINPVARGATLPAKVAWETAFGAGIGLGGRQAQVGLDEGRLLTGGEALESAGYGAGAGFFLGSGIHGAQAAYAARQVKAQEAAKAMRNLWEGSHQADPLGTLQKGGRYLEEMAAGMEPPPMPPPVPTLPPSRQLPALAGPDSLGAPLPPHPISAFPPGTDPNLVDVVQPGRRILANEPPPDPFETVLEQALQQPPGPPRLRAGEGPPSLGLTAPPVPPGAARKVQPSLRTEAGRRIQPPRSDRSVLQQTGDLGGAKSTPGQPRIPGVLSPRPASETRDYPTGPNANPRRQGELHGVPREYKKQNRRSKTKTYGKIPTSLLAEDPGMYPPEVRRDLADILNELEEFQYDSTLILPEASTYRRMEDAPKRITESNAPVYHEIKALLEGNRGRERGGATSQQLRKAISDALLEGKGSLISDAAAQVARKGWQRVLPPGYGDRLINWKDAEDLPVLNPYHPDPAYQTVEALEDQEIKDGLKILQELGGVEGVEEGSKPFFKALQHVALRRGMAEETQQELLMEAPGAAGKLSVRAKRGDPLGSGQAGDAGQAALPTLDEIGDVLRQRAAESEARWALRRSGVKTADLPPRTLTGKSIDEDWATLRRQRGEDQSNSPGTEGVRDQNIPTPPVSEAPFALTPPPTPTRIPPRTSQGSLFDRLSREEGMFVYRKPANDRKGLQAWMKQQEKEHGTEPWFVRAEQAIVEKDWDRAWQLVGHASTRSVMKARAHASPTEQAAIDQMLKGTPLQDDLPTQLVAKARSRAGVGTAPPVPVATVKGPAGTYSGTYPPSPRVTQAGAARGDATMGPAGIINPGAPKRPLSSAAPSLRAGTLDVAVMREVLKHTDAAGKAIIPGNTDANLRIGRQIVEDMFQGKNLEGLREAGIEISNEELAQYGQQAISSWGRGLNLLSQFVQKNQPELMEEAERMSFGGALRGMLPKSLGGTPTPLQATTGAGGRTLGKEAREVLQEIEGVNQTLSSNLATAVLIKKPKVGLIRGIHDLSYPYMLMRPATAVRNFLDATNRYSIDSFVHALTVPWAKITGPLTGDYSIGKEAAAQFKERGLLMYGKDAAVSPRRALHDSVQTIWDLGRLASTQVKGSSSLHSLKILTEMPELSAHFLGMLKGENLRERLQDVPGLKYLANERLLKLLSVWQNTQELTARATIFNATMRGQVRAAGFDPSDLLSRDLSEIKSAVGDRSFARMAMVSVQTALEGTYAGAIAKDSVPSAVLRIFDAALPLKLVQAFPRFSFSAAPRWIADHEPLMGIYEVLRHGVDLSLAKAGIGVGSQAGGRLTRGVRARHIEQKVLPQVLLKHAEAQEKVVEGLGKLEGMRLELGASKRLVARLEKEAEEATGQKGLPGILNQLTDETAQRNFLQDQFDAAKSRWNQDRQLAMDLQAVANKHLDVVNNAHGINAPTYAQFLARQTAGMGLLGAAILIRSQEDAQGTEWYKYPVTVGGDEAGEGGSTYNIDFRAFPGISHFMFVGDVIQDTAKHTDWANYQQERESGASITDAWWNSYEGKYTRQELGKQLLQAMLSISRPAGTTLTLTDLISRSGTPGVEEVLQAMIGTIGQFAARFGTVGQPVRDLVGNLVPEENVLREIDDSLEGQRLAPLWQPMAGNFPGTQRLLRPRIDSLTGKPMPRTPTPLSFLGLGVQEQNAIQAEIQRTGVPASSVFFSRTGDAEVDQITKEEYGKILQEHFQAILQGEEYQQLLTPALKRDYLQSQVFPVLKAAAVAQAAERLGVDRWEESHLRGEDKRRAARQKRLLDRLAGGEDVDQGAPQVEEEIPVDLDSDLEPPPIPPTF